VLWLLLVVVGVVVAGVAAVVAAGVVVAVFDAVVVGVVVFYMAGVDHCFRQDLKPPPPGILRKSIVTQDLM